MARGVPHIFIARSEHSSFDSLELHGREKNVENKQINQCHYLLQIPFHTVERQCTLREQKISILGRKRQQQTRILNLKYSHYELIEESEISTKLR